MKVQCVKRKSGDRQWYVSLPAHLARSQKLSAGEEVEWRVSDTNHLVLCRTGSRGHDDEVKKTLEQSFVTNFWQYLERWLGA